ncbi:MAG: hypothetical protein V7K32_17905 [Nostoc sp.]|uniref:hypothetical protein n=1 Tax=Nostoc sp. TaxID=1180 RepID=UPI002FF958E1
MTDNILQQQIDYYRARANEYDEWFYSKGRYDRGIQNNQCWFKEVAVIKNTLHQIGVVDDILELGDFQIKKCSKTDAKTLSISSLCVLCAAVAHGGNPQDRAALSLWFVYWNNLFLVSP